MKKVRRILTEEEIQEISYYRHVMHATISQIAKISKINYSRLQLHFREEELKLRPKKQIDYPVRVCDVETRIEYTLCPPRWADGAFVTRPGHNALAHHHKD